MQATNAFADESAITGSIHAAVHEVRTGVAEHRGLTTVHVRTGLEQDAVIGQLAADPTMGTRWKCVSLPLSVDQIVTAIDSDAATGAGRLKALHEPLERAARSGVWTVLAVRDAHRASEESLAFLSELTTLEPMLQLVLVGVGDYLSGSASSLALRVRQRVEVSAERPAFVAPAPASGRTPETPTPRPAPVTPRLAERGASSASSAASPPGSGRAPIGSPHGDPFRGVPAEVTLNTPELIPVLNDPHGPHAEWFRILRVRLEDWARGAAAGSKAIAITGPDMGVGKSFVAVNLAILWAHNSFERVLLVDADLRRPQFHALFEIPRRPGLADVLAGRVDAEQATAFISEIGLHVLPAGRPGNPRELVDPMRVARALDELRDRFDVIILDTPPLSGLVDTRSFAAAADGVVGVVRSGTTRFSRLTKSLAGMARDNLIGVVVNGADPDSHSAYAQYREAVEK